MSTVPTSPPTAGTGIGQLLSRDLPLKSRPTVFWRERYSWYVVALVVLVAFFTYADDITHPGGTAALESWPAYFTALQRFLFLVAIAIATWRFGVRAGLIIGAILGAITLSPFLNRPWQPDAWLDVAVIAIGVLFSWLIGRQRRMEELLQKAPTSCGSRRRGCCGKSASVNRPRRR